MLTPFSSKSGILTTFANLARAVAASSALKLVDTPKLIIVLVKSVKDSVAIPNCPAISITPAISDALDGISSDISRIFCLNFAYSSSVASTVFFTPVNAVSNSFPTATDATVAAATAAPATPAAVAIAPKHFFPAFIVASKPLSSVIKFLSIARILAFNAVFAVARLALKDLSITPAILIASLYSFPFVANLDHILYRI